MSETNTDDFVTQLATRQYGLVARWQLGHRLTRHAIDWRLRCGDWRRVYQGVYCLRGAPDCWRQRALAAALFAGDGALLSHVTAAFLYRLDGFRDRSLQFHLTVRRGEYPRAGGLVVHRTADSLRRCWIHSLPVTPLARTLIDLSGELDPLPLELALDSAQRRFPSVTHWLRHTLATEGTVGRRGVSLLKELLACRTDGATASALEVLVRRRLLSSPLPHFRRQHEFFDADGFIARVDFFFPLHGVVLHCDSYRWHHARERFELDRAQRNRLARLGLEQLTVTWRDLDTQLWLETLGAVLARRDPQHALPLWTREVPHPAVWGP